MDNVSNRHNRPTQVRNDVASAAPPRPSGMQANGRPQQSRRGSSKKKITIIIASLLLAGAVIAVLVYAFNRSSAATVIDSSKYQAVFVTNGDVYFGKLSAINSEYMRLTDVYYPQKKADAGDEKAAAKQDASDVELIKRGNEIHGPEDEIIIAKDQIFFFENLKPTGAVSQTISNYQKDK